MTGIPSQIDLLGHALRFAQQAHGVISQNIANVNTPGFMTKQLSFDQFLETVQTHNSDSSPPDDFQVEMAKGLVPRADGNNVDLDQEVANLKKNGLMYQAFSQLLAAKMDTMRRAITG